MFNRGGGTGEAGEATASPEFRGFTTEKFLASWIYERGKGMIKNDTLENHLKVHFLLLF